MSARRGDRDAVALKPWEVSFNGYRWHQMPGCTEEDKKLNFFLYRRGLLQVDEIEVERRSDAEAAAFIERCEAPAKTKRLVSREQRFFGGGYKGRRRVKVAKRGPKERPAEDLTLRTRLKTRLMMAKDTYGAIRQITLRAGLPEFKLRAFFVEDRGLTMERVRLVHDVLDALERGEWQIVSRIGKRGERPRVCPAGMMSYNKWLEREAAKRGMKAHSLRIYLDRHPAGRPEIFKRGTRSWFVKEDAA